ncbi:MAG: holo-ACP synthase [Caldimicrobium sp.]
MTFLGVGIDLVYIPRIKNLINRYQIRFLTRLFTEEELDYAFKKRNPSQALASAFAVKEAFYKALGGYSPFRFKEISLARCPSTGKPFVRLSGRAEEIFKERKGQKIDLSLSHDFNYTIAIVQIWGEG